MDQGFNHRVSQASDPVGRASGNGAGFLIAGAVLSGIAALGHLACIVVGAPLYRLMGAGEQMAQLHISGHWYPTTVTLVITAILCTWSLYALSGAGVIRKLPLLRTALCAITAIYIVRGVAFMPLMAQFPGNSMLFWVISSSVCLAIGLVHLMGVRRSWASF
jgi:hypothetical protein